jgi:hypothetical protein
MPDLAALLRELRPTLHPGVYAFCVLPPGRTLDFPIVGTFREAEGLTVIVEEAVAAAHGLDVAFRAAWVTLGVDSDLHAVGLTAAVARELADAGIACNVVAAVHHDHLFVPFERGAEAVAVLERVSVGARSVSEGSGEYPR